MNSPVIFITGAGKGIGEACVLELIKRAHSTNTPPFRPKLFLTARTKSDLDRLAGLAQKAGLACEILAADLAQEPLQAFETCLKVYGRVDACFHSAGVGRFKNLEELTREDLQFVMQTNVEASFLLMQAVYAQMKKQKSGQIQWITSIAAERPFEQSAVYCMSKYAQRGLIDVMRLYGYRDGIRIVEVKPGAVYTPMWGPEVTPEMKSKMMMPEDIAQAMVDALFIPERTTLEEITLRPLHGDL